MHSIRGQGQILHRSNRETDFVWVIFIMNWGRDHYTYTIAIVLFFGQYLGNVYGESMVESADVCVFFQDGMVVWMSDDLSYNYLSWWISAEWLNQLPFHNVHREHIMCIWIHIQGGVLKSEMPQAMGFNTKMVYSWMIWAYPNFRTPPCVCCHQFWLNHDPGVSHYIPCIKMVMAWGWWPWWHSLNPRYLLLKTTYDMTWHDMTWHDWGNIHMTQLWQLWLRPSGYQGPYPMAPPNKTRSTAPISQVPFMLREDIVSAPISQAPISQAPLRILLKAWLT